MKMIRCMGEVLKFKPACRQKGFNSLKFLKIEFVNIDESIPCLA